MSRPPDSNRTDTDEKPGFTPVQTSTISDLIYAQIKNAILSGAMAPSERLVESTLAAQLNASRTPLRQALLALEKEGLLERLPQGGLRVPPFSVREVKELYELRAVLESFAARRAAERVRADALTERERQEISRMTQLLEEAVDRVKRVDAEEADLAYTTDFHLLVSRLSDNLKLMPLLEGLSSSMKRYRAFVPPSRNLAGLEEHLAVIRAIEAGNGPAAEAAMRMHIENSAVIYRSLLADTTKHGTPQIEAL